MIIIAAVDDRNGLTFNHRRQSKDKALRERVISLVFGSKLWMNAYSQKQFAEDQQVKINVSEEFLSEALPGEFCFIENVDIAPYTKWIERVVLFKWNRAYPGDAFLTLDLTDDSWRLVESEDFVGNSHEKITMEVYAHEEV